MKRTIVLISAVLLITSGILYAQGQGRLIGGACSYDRISGTCQIISVTKTSESIRQAQIGGGPGYEGYEIKFKFTPSEEKLEYRKASGGGIEDIVNKEHTLQLTNSWYPGDKFLEKYMIKEGKVFNCVLCLITKGTCTPVLFEFPDINTSDYFETEE
jgi:hypothetical protein